MAATSSIRPLPSHQLAMPAQDGVRSHDCRDLRKQQPPKPVAQDREASAVTVVEAQTLPRQADLQNAILLPQECDDISLLTMEPATQRGDQQLEREHAGSLTYHLTAWDLGCKQKLRIAVNDRLGIEPDAA
jgi:hypothetical protein